jgi:membrane associated rhomboid family serine protease
MSETELSVICKSCGSEVSPYVTECPYCGARLRKRAPKLERRGDGLEPKAARKAGRRRLRLPRGLASLGEARPYASVAAILASALLLLLQHATADPLATYGGVIVPYTGDWWRFLTAPFAYTDVGYLFVVALGLAIFGTGLERRLGSIATGILLLACGSLGILVAASIADAQDKITVIAGGNGMALGAAAAWFALRRGEASRTVAQDFDAVGVAVAAAVLIALPLFDSSADFFAGIIGGALGGIAGMIASALRASR